MSNETSITLPKGTKVPNHIAIIPDGNRRWARARGLNTLEGHKRGFTRAVELSRVARNLGVHTITLWGFSTENWDRSKDEVSYLMKLYAKLVDDYLKEARENDARIYHLGRKDRLPKFLLNKVKYAEDSTKNNKTHVVNLAIDYGGHDDIIRAARKMVHDRVSEDEVTKELFEKYLDTHDQPYPYVDLIIRTSGEQRTSGLMTWQAAYAETYWENDHFPDFTPEKLKLAILDYSRRRRRFGANDKEEHFKFKPELVAQFEVAWWRLSKIPEGTRFRDYAIRHLGEQYGLSKRYAVEAANLMMEAMLGENKNKWVKAKRALKMFYSLIKDEVKLAFEPELVASLEIKLRKEMMGKNEIQNVRDLEGTAQELYAEVYRISLLQAAKLAHLRILAAFERNLAERGMGEEHWVLAQDYLEKFYSALKDRVA
ncbi:di-trans,poly-cis-decaprenylcistransferase [Candidatus Woesebacteria bacterium]|nr:di-trans,poly-cis-decaprenylcistransferase [Candidatus Woesebacteria bacterium]